MKKLLAVLLILSMMMTAAVAISAVTVDPDDVDYMELFNCDEIPMGNLRQSMSLDKENKTEGEASLSIDIGESAVNEFQFSEAIDGTGYDTFEFDMYVSDVAFFDMFSGAGYDNGFEITSSGRDDHQEIAWKLNSIKNNNRGEPVKTGWNHIILPLTSATITEGTQDGSKAGPFNISNINYMRFYVANNNSDRPNSGITVKLDNFQLSNYDAVETQLRIEEQNEKKAKAVSDDIEALPEVTAENYLELKDTVKDIRKDYDRLNQEAKDLIGASVRVKLTRAEEAIANFEKNPPDPNPPKEDNENETPNEGENNEQKPTDDKSGCASVVGVGAVAMILMTCGLGVTVLKKKD